MAKRSKESGFRTVTAEISSDLWDLAAMNRAFAGTEVAFSLALTLGAHSLTIAGNVATEPFSVGVDGVGGERMGFESSGPRPLRHPYKGKALILVGSSVSGPHPRLP